jgi:hypothetical protein
MRMQQRQEARQRDGTGQCLLLEGAPLLASPLRRENVKLTTVRYQKAIMACPLGRASPFVCA